ncbi:CAAX protease [Helicobacter cetorum]|uniref:CAAX protease n=1 Tax=Helicobacter cetorum TaxID=138563 RepID=UPI000CF16B96|nr:CAAX protease [Helicobacter cetorum]
MHDLQNFKNDITLILSKERLIAYDNLEQYKENLKLISLITPKISNLEIYLRNALDYCLTHIKGSEWVFESNNKGIKKAISHFEKEKLKHPNKNDILSRLTLGVIVSLISANHLQFLILSLKDMDFKRYYSGNTNKIRIGSTKSKISNILKAKIALNLLRNIRNRAYHWENLLKTKYNTPNITNEINGVIVGIMPNKIVLFLDDLIKSIGNKDLEKLSEFGCQSTL